MKVLLDTNIIIHREASKVVNYDIGQLFKWLDNLNYSKYIHPITVEEISGHNDKDVVKSFNIKLGSYNFLKYPAEMGDVIAELSEKVDNDENDINDTLLLNQVLEKTVDILITEDRKIHHKARLLNIADNVFRIQSFLEKVHAENPELIDYKILAVKQYDFGEINIDDPFFDSFKKDYSEFKDWFRSKSEKRCYASFDKGLIAAFLYIKIEKEGKESYKDITPTFDDKKRLKIGTLKVEKNGLKIGERFLKIVFENAYNNKVEEIYVTIFNRRSEQRDLIKLLMTWGFVHHGIKTSKNGKEQVFVRPFGKSLPINLENPKFTYPFFSRETRKYIVRIKPEYHTALFPDSINTKEDKSQYQQHEVHSNRIGKVYISHNKDRHLTRGDVILIYRIGEEGTKKTFSSTITSICIVEDVITHFSSFEEFFNTCNRRTLLDKAELEKWWNRFSWNRPFVIKFLYAFSLPTPKPTLKDLDRMKIMPIFTEHRGFIEINNTQLNRLIKFAYKQK